MRSARRTVVCVVLVSAVVLTGCSGDVESGTSAAEASSSPAVTDGTDDAEDDGEPVDSDTDSPVPATVEVSVDDLPGFDAVAFWRGTEVVDGPRQVTGQLDVDGETLLVQVSSLEDVLARETSEQELRAWVRDNPFTTGPVDVLDPVAVDGAELLHARGDDGLAQWDRYTLVASSGEALSVMFSLPLDLPDAEREDYIASVMATVELE